MIGPNTYMLAAIFQVALDAMISIDKICSGCWRQRRGQPRGRDNRRSTPVALGPIGPDPGPWRALAEANFRSKSDPNANGQARRLAEQGARGPLRGGPPLA